MKSVAERESETQNQGGEYISCYRAHGCYRDARESWPFVWKRSILIWTNALCSMHQSLWLGMFLLNFICGLRALLILILNLHMWQFSRIFSEFVTFLLFWAISCHLLHLYTHNSIYMARLAWKKKRNAVHIMVHGSYFMASHPWVIYFLVL
jgi:hypothetical protein